MIGTAHGSPTKQIFVCDGLEQAYIYVFIKGSRANGGVKPYTAPPDMAESGGGGIPLQDKGFYTGKIFPVISDFEVGAFGSRIVVGKALSLVSAVPLNEQVFRGEVVIQTALDFAVYTADVLMYLRGNHFCRNACIIKCFQLETVGISEAVVIRHEYTPFQLLCGSAVLAVQQRSPPQMLPATDIGRRNI